MFPIIAITFALRKLSKKARKRRLENEPNSLRDIEAEGKAELDGTEKECEGPYELESSDVAEMDGREVKEICDEQGIAEMNGER
ncbi:hypothetical protein N0V90_009842 [Kalmusia sp. IMI 367209]|nr:hypothetical protein N0V90_009842 [Kalmusia sp. IMI 367209]